MGDDVITLVTHWYILLVVILGDTNNAKHQNYSSDRISAPAREGGRLNESASMVIVTEIRP